jgi:hypothetical protein
VKPLRLCHLEPVTNQSQHDTRRPDRFAVPIYHCSYGTTTAESLLNSVDINNRDVITATTAALPPPRTLKNHFAICMMPSVIRSDWLDSLPFQALYDQRRHS